MMATRGLKKIKDNSYYDLGLLVDGNISEDIVILGASRAWRTIDPKIVDSVTQLESRVVGLNGAGCYTQRALWKTFLENNKYTPKVLVQVVGSLEIFSRKDGIHNFNNFIPYLDDPSIINSLKKLNPRIWEDRYIPLYKYRGFPQEFVKGLLGSVDLYDGTYDRYKGYQAENKDWGSESKLINFSEVSNYEIAPGIELLKEEVALAKQMEIPLVLVFVPEQAQVKDIVPQRKELIRELYLLQKESNSFLFLDYSDWEHDRDTTLFAARLHLNQRGSKLFSVQFAKDLNSFLKNQKITKEVQ